MAFVGGEDVTADKLNRATEKIIARGRRTTTSGGSTGATIEVLRLDDIPIRAGYLYAICTNSLALQSTAANNTVRAEIRYTTDGSTPVAATTVIPGGATQQSPSVAGQSDNSAILALYAPGSNETLSLLLTVRRTTGAGTATIFADATNTIEMWVEQKGEDPGDTGVDL